MSSLPVAKNPSLFAPVLPLPKCVLHAPAPFEIAVVSFMQPGIPSGPGPRSKTRLNEVIGSPTWSGAQTMLAPLSQHASAIGRVDGLVKVPPVPTPTANAEPA